MTSILFSRPVYAVVACACCVGVAAPRAQGRSAPPHAESAAPVVMRGADVAPLAGVEPHAVRAIVVRDGVAQSIAVQVDERVTDDSHRAYETERYVLTHGAGALTDTDPMLDATDEIVFMARDVSPERAAALPACTSPILEVHVQNPASGVSGYVYLGAFPSIPPSRKTYVRYDPAADVITTDVYRLGFHPKRRATFDEMRIRMDDGQWSDDILDRIKVRVSGEVFFRGLRFHRTENDIRADVIGYTPGPVRLIRRTAVRLRVLPLIWTRAKEEDNVFYKDYFDVTTKVASPKNLNALVREAHLRSTTDMTEATRGWRFYSNTNPAGVIVDGVMSPEEMTLVRTDHTWAGLAGPHGGVLARMRATTPEGDPLPIERGLFYLDDARVDDPPEDVPGNFGHYGYDIRNILELESGRYDISNTGYVYRGQWEVALPRLLAILDAPPQITTRTVTD